MILWRHTLVVHRLKLQARVRSGLFHIFQESLKIHKNSNLLLKEGFLQKQKFLNMAWKLLTILAVPNNITT